MVSKNKFLKPAGFLLINECEFWYVFFLLVTFVICNTK